DGSHPKWAQYEASGPHFRDGGPIRLGLASRLPRLVSDTIEKAVLSAEREYRGITRGEGVMADVREQITARRGTGAPRTVFSVLAGLDEDLRSGQGKAFLPLPTGFQATDHTLAGGVRA